MSIPVVICLLAACWLLGWTVGRAEHQNEVVRAADEKELLRIGRLVYDDDDGPRYRVRRYRVVEIVDPRRDVWFE